MTWRTVLVPTVFVLAMVAQEAPSFRPLLHVPEAKGNWREEKHLLSSGDYAALQFLLNQAAIAEKALGEAQMKADDANLNLDEARKRITAAFNPYEECKNGDRLYRTVEIDGPQVVVREGTAKGCGATITGSGSIFGGSADFVWAGPGSGTVRRQ